MTGWTDAQPFISCIFAISIAAISYVFPKPPIKALFFDILIFFVSFFFAILPFSLLRVFWVLIAFKIWQSKAFFWQAIGLGL